MQLGLAHAWLLTGLKEALSRAFASSRETGLGLRSEICGANPWWLYYAGCHELNVAISTCRRLYDTILRYVDGGHCGVVAQWGTVHVGPQLVCTKQPQNLHLPFGRI